MDQHACEETRFELEMLPPLTNAHIKCQNPYAGCHPAIKKKNQKKNIKEELKINEVVRRYAKECEHSKEVDDALQADDN